MGPSVADACKRRSRRCGYVCYGRYDGICGGLVGIQLKIQTVIQRLWLGLKNTNDFNRNGLTIWAVLGAPSAPHQSITCKTRDQNGPFGREASGEFFVRPPLVIALPELLDQGGYLSLHLRKVIALRLEMLR